MTVFFGLLGLSCVYPSSLVTVHFSASCNAYICLENSFWYRSSSISFVDAFCKAFGIYTETATQETVEIALKELGDFSERTAFKSALSETLLRHRLRMLNYVFSYQLFLIIVVRSGHPDNLEPSNRALMFPWMSFSLL